jgi:signal transduction histidine kinase
VELARAALARALADAGARVDTASLLLMALEIYSTTREAELRDESLFEIVGDAFAQLTQRVENDPGVVCVNGVAPDRRAVVDRTSLLLALQNVMQNAAEARKPGAARVEIRATAEALGSGRGVEIRVSDDGVGMTPEQCARLADVYWTTKATGSGLGTAMAKRAIEETHGGEWIVESEPGRGTTVKMRLPAAEIGHGAARSRAGARKKRTR